MIADRQSIGLLNDLYSREPTEFRIGDRAWLFNCSSSFYIRELVVPSAGLAYVTGLI